MRKRTLVSLILTIVMILTASGIASAADSWQYYFPITVSDNSGATRTAYPIILEVGGQSLVDGGYLTANGTDARLRTTADKNLLMSTTNITFTLDSLPAYGQVTYNLYTGYSPEIDAFQIIVGDGGYVTVADNTTIELGDNFTVEQGGWVDTTAGDNKTLVSKPQAFRTYVSPVVSGNITAAVSAGSPTSDNLSTNGAGDETGVFTLVGSTQWEAVQTNDGDTSYISTPNATYVESSFNLSPFPSTSGNISSVTVTFTIRMDDPGTGYATPKLRLDGVDSDGTEQSRNAQTYVSYTQTITRPGGGSWADYDLEDLQVGIALKGTGTVNIRCTYLTVTVNYTPEISVTASGVSSGEHVVTTSMDSPFLSLGIDAGSDIPPVGGSLELNAPMWQTELDADPFDSIDDNTHSCDVDGPTWTDEGYDFDGTNDEIVLTADNNTGSKLNFTSGDFSIGMWFYPIGTGDSNTALFYRGDLNVEGYGLRYREDDNRIIFDTFQGGAQQSTSVPGGNFPQNSWYHLVVTRSGANALFYKNGADLGVTSATHINPVTCDIAARMGENNDGAYDYEGIIGEVRVYSQALSPAEVLKNYNATSFKYTSGDITTYSTLASVPDNANDWVFYQNNVLPYADNTTIWVGGVRQLWFEPNEMITGTTLPDRATSVANDGTITWGANDQITVTFGSVTSYEATVSAATTNVTGFVLPLVGIPDNWWGMEFDGEDLPFYPTFLDTSTQTGIPLQTLYLLVVFGVAIALATVTIVLTRSVLVGVAFYTVTMAYGANAGIVAWWIIYVFLIMIIGIIFLSSRQAMGG